LLDSLALGDRFDEVVSTQHARGQTTKLAEMKSLLARLRVLPQEVLWVEDASPEIPEIRALGVAVAIVRRPYNADKQRQANWVID
jgi:beta-phosphoglucomutase-like phosphatase (HAD superfamily)